MRRAWLAWAAALLPGAALAAAYDVEARTEAQAYTVGGSSALAGRPLLRRRLVQLLDLAGFELVPGEDAGLQLTVRLDADFAVPDAEVSRLDEGHRERLQLLAGRLHWDGLAGGRLDLEAGRVVAQGPVAFFSFDGGRVTARPLPWLALTGFGGLRVTGASWLGSSTFAPDGVRTSDLRRLRAGVPLLPCADLFRGCADPTLDEPEPTLGARLALLQLPGTALGGAEVEYRRTLRSGAIVEERVGGGAHYRVGPVGLDGAGEYDLYLQRLTVLRLGARWAPRPWLGISAEASHRHESFAADSIFNVFDTAPRREARLRADLGAEGTWRGYLAGGAQHYGATDYGQLHFGDQGGYAPSAAAGLAGSLGATQLGADGTVTWGAQGQQAWLVLVARRPWRGWLVVEGRGTLARVRDPVQGAYDGTFASAALLLAGRLERRAQLSLLLEDSTPRLDRNDLRLFAFLTLGADWDGRAP